MPPLYTYREYHKGDPELKNIDWSLLRESVTALAKYQTKFSNDVEEKPPIITDDSFLTGGWVGKYGVGRMTVDVEPGPDRLSLEDFKLMRNELVGWIEHVGPALQDLSKLYMNEAIFKQLLFRVYSKRLIELTEILVSQFIPRKANVVEFIGHELKGKPLWKKMILERAKNSTLLVSRRTKFDTRTLQNLLLVRFHAELLRDYNGFIKANSVEGDFDSLLKNFYKAKSYHSQFLSKGIWASLLEESLVTNFDNKETMDRIKSDARNEIAEIIDLWDAYRSHKSFLVDFGHRFDIALKPLSKVYELWCLLKLCNILGIDPFNIKELPIQKAIKCGRVGQNLGLYYCRSMPNYSGIMSKVRSGFHVGKPDFAIESNNAITMILDAKCKTIDGIDIGDMHRLLSYILDYIYPTNESLTGVIFLLSNDHAIKNIKVKGCDIFFVPLTPTTYETNKAEVEKILQQSYN